MKSIVRKSKTIESKKADFYQTNPLMSKVLIDWFKENEFNTSLGILDPCCGKHSITNELNKYFNNVSYFDKFEGDNKLDYLEEIISTNIIVMNPPYSTKYDFINKARTEANYVFCLLPLNISNYNMFHREYEDIPEFMGKIQMAPKMFLDETIDFKAGGNSQYCWYIWHDSNNTKYSKTWYYDLKKYIGENNEKDNKIL